MMMVMMMTTGNLDSVYQPTSTPTKPRPPTARKPKQLLVKSHLKRIESCHIHHKHIRLTPESESFIAFVVMDCKPRKERSKTKDFIVISFWTSFFFQVAGICGKAAIQKDKLGIILEFWEDIRILGEYPRILEFWENIRILEEYPRILEVWENIRNWENIRVLGEWRYHGGFNCAQNNATTAYNYWYEMEVKTYKDGIFFYKMTKD